MPNAACPSAHAELSPPTTAPSCLFPSFQLHGLVSCTGDVSGLPSLSSWECPSVSHKDHQCSDQHFQEFCFLQKSRDSGDFLDASLARSRCCICSQAPAAKESFWGHGRLTHRGLKYNSVTIESKKENGWKSTRSDCGARPGQLLCQCLT